MYNPFLVVPIVTWAVAQSLKFIIAALRGRLDFKYLYASGGMPSVHSAVVTSLVVTAYLVSGPQSPIFGLSVILAGIVIYDSFGVRRASGEQAAAINMLIASLSDDRVKLQNPRLKLREILGHNPLEVTVGAVLGIAMGALFNINHLGPQLLWLTSLPPQQEMLMYVVIFALILVTGLGLRLGLTGAAKRSAGLRTLARRVLWTSQTIGWVGLLLGFAVYERASYLSWRVWLLSWLLVAVVWLAWLLASQRRELPGLLAAEHETARRGKWLPKAKKRK
jgi:uncharacterized protein